MQRKYTPKQENNILYVEKGTFYAMSLQATVVREILQSAASHGAAYDTLCQLTGVTNEEISDSTKMVEWEKAALIWNPLL